MKASFFTYLKAAFNARPLGMPIPPNWVAIAAAGFIGFIDPGYWIIAVGLELGYLLLLATNSRFRKTVDGELVMETSGQWEQQRAKLMQQLPSAERTRQSSLEERCRTILDSNKDDASQQQQAENLAQLAWVHLRLLLSRRRVQQVIDEADKPAELSRRIRDLEHQIANSAQATDATHEKLHKSLSSQLDILTARQASHNKAHEQLTLIDAELERLRQQVELVREQSMLSSDAGAASRTIDALGATLNETTRWLSDQREVLGEMEDLSTAPPPAAIFSAQTTGQS